MPQILNERAKHVKRLMQGARLPIVALYLCVPVCTVAFIFTVGSICASVLQKGTAGKRDFIAYWASGQLFAHKVNPYDGRAILALERAAGFTPGHPLIMRNPPTALLLVLPLGFVGPWAGELLWSALLIGCLVASVRMVWVVHGRPRDKLHLLGYSFGPALICVAAGQTGLLALLGLSCFLYFHRHRPFFAGLFLWFCLLKPHLFLPFAAVLFAWAILTRRYKILLGAALTLAVSATVAQALDAHVWAQYVQMLRWDNVDRPAIPCISIMLRRAVNPDYRWLQYLPAALGCVWALNYFRRHRAHWNWMEQGSLLTLVSLAVAPYAWITDQAILIPAMLHAAYLTRSRSLLALFVLASAAIETGIFRRVQPFQSPLYIWTVPAWLAWYLCAVRSGGVGQDSLPMAAPLTPAKDAYP